MSEQPTVLARGARVWDTAYITNADESDEVIVYRANGFWYRESFISGQSESYTSAEAAMNGLTAAEVGE